LNAGLQAMQVMLQVMKNGHHLQKKCPFGGPFFKDAGDAGDNFLANNQKKEMKKGGGVGNITCNHLHHLHTTDPGPAPLSRFDPPPIHFGPIQFAAQAQPIDDLPLGLAQPISKLCR
jgi:hypothetical protein